MINVSLILFFRLMDCACNDEDTQVQDHALWALRLYFRNTQCKKVILSDVILEFIVSYYGFIAIDLIQCCV